MWPFKTEDRLRTGFTDLFVNQLLAQAGGNVYADVCNTAAAELCSGLWGRAFASAELSPAIPRNRAGHAGKHRQSLDSRGEYLWGAIDVENGGLRLIQAYSWDITGGADPRSWHYSLELPGPSGNETGPSGGRGSSLPVGDLPLYSVPGQGPFQSASLTGALLANLEKTLAAEAGRRQAGMSCRRRRMNGTRGASSQHETLKGHTGVVETTAAGWGQGEQSSAPGRTGQSNALEVIRRRSFENSVRTPPKQSSLPVSLLDSLLGTPTVRPREAIRRWFHTSVSPVGRQVEAELRTKLEMPGLTLTFPGTRGFCI